MAKFKKLLFIFTSLIMATYLGFYAPLPFFSSVWEDRYNQPHKFLDTPHRMVDGFLITNRLKGKSQSEIEELLGVPPETSYFSDWDMVYRLGTERGFIGIDSEWLVLQLDNDGKVIDAQIVYD